MLTRDEQQTIIVQSWNQYMNHTKRCYYWDKQINATSDKNIDPTSPKM